METADSLRRPRSLPVGHDIPPGSRLEKIQEAYRDLPEAIHCGLADCRTPHKNGYVVSFTTTEGQSGEGLLGHVCGGKLFGVADWKASVRAHEIQQQLASVAGDLLEKTEQCREIEAHLPALHEIASLVYNARTAFQVDLADFFKVCELASRRFGGVVAGDDRRTGKKFEVRLPHREFWIREDVGRRAARLQGDVRLFLSRAHLCTTAKDQSSMMVILGSPRDEVRRLLAAITNDIQALFPRNMETAVMGYKALSGARNLRVHERLLQTYHDGWGYMDPKWELHTDLGFYPQLAKKLMPITEALARRPALA